ncbi:MAG: hypothetical protein R3B39_00525 [Candidatus Paceibacterota bacterium]
MGKVINLQDYLAQKLQESVPPNIPRNIYEFLLSEYGEGEDEQIIELLATIYRRICDISGYEHDFSIVGKGKDRRTLRNF